MQQMAPVIPRNLLLTLARLSGERASGHHPKMPKISETDKRDLGLLQEAYHQLWTVGPEERNPNDFVWPLKRYLIAEDILVTPALEHHLGREGKERHRRLSDDDESVC